MSKLDEDKCKLETHSYQFSSKSCESEEDIWHSAIALMLSSEISDRKLIKRRRCKQCKFVWRWGVDWNKRTEQWLGDYGI